MNKNIILPIITMFVVIMLIAFPFNVVEAKKITKTIVNYEFDLHPRDDTYFSFSIPKKAINPFLSGSIEVIGGIIPAVILQIYFSDDCPSPNFGYINFLYCDKPYYSSFILDGGKVKKYLPSGETYYLRIENSAFIEKKEIRPSLTLSYTK